MKTIIFSLLSILSLISPSSSKCNSNDRRALTAIYAHLGKPASLSATWTAPHVACCDWAGVDCYSKSNRVRNLNLGTLNLSVTTIPPAVGDLPKLQGLTLSGNSKIVGTIPASLTRLKDMLYLDLSSNSLSGPIPEYLSQIISLTFLDLSFNKFGGSIPASLPKLKNLGALILSNNELTGSIPDFSGFGNGNILMSHNRLSGPIPRSLGDLGTGRIDLSYNKLTGDASFLFGSSKPATEFHLQHNKLSFDLTRVSFPLNTSALELNNNFIYGSIPAQINQVTGFVLTEFNVSYNLLCGQIPPGPVTASFSVWSFFHNKCLCGTPLPPCK